MIKHRNRRLSLFLFFEISSVLAFMGTNGSGFQIEYPAITLHAVSRGESGPSIYCQLDESIGAENGTAIANEDTIPEMRELTIVPQNASSRTSFFSSFTRLFSSFHVSYFFFRMICSGSDIRSPIAMCCTPP